MSDPIRTDDGRRDALSARLFEATLGAFELLSVHLGLDLGPYEALRVGGPATAAELATRRGIHERYAREWLEQQAVAGLLDVVEASEDPGRRRYALPAAH
ncbi:MAG: SAM-dependent methyltransferase, partial [Chloroflexi bacterium]|nr:SAM-dependent methyltransferase [Chloroflexota bacterium]